MTNLLGKQQNTHVQQAAGRHVKTRSLQEPILYYQNLFSTHEQYGRRREHLFYTRVKNTAYTAQHIQLCNSGYLSDKVGLAGGKISAVNRCQPCWPGYAQAAVAYGQGKTHTKKQKTQLCPLVNRRAVLWLRESHQQVAWQPASHSRNFQWKGGSAGGLPGSAIRK